MEAMKVMMAGGGTGGHVFPALAVAAELRRRHPAHEVLFVGTEQGIETRVVPGAGFPLRTLPLAGFKGVSPVAKLRSLVLFSRSLFRTRRLLGEFRPDVVFG
ncbi:glycosyltransferase, partial [Acidobacteriia bacterium AH_259_A11_L15]|nr:glycosyltransferase [Acidobacteriia bacterium AH_259_A11_L15]